MYPEEDETQLFLAADKKRRRFSDSRLVTSFEIGDGKQLENKRYELFVTAKQRRY
jgi:hypothetical protein